MDSAAGTTAAGGSLNETTDSGVSILESNREMGRFIAIASLIGFTSLGASGQVATASSVFEVASVRQNKTGSRGGSMDFPKGGERFTATNMPFGALVLIAYNITVRQLSGPAEFLSEKYDIAAKAEHAVSPDEMLRMLQAL